jgi:hypothetical protein
MIFGLIFLFGLVFGLILVAYEDGLPFGLYQRIRCKVGKCKFYIKVGKTKINKYYCLFCKKPRKFPVLKVIDGERKIGDNKFRR